MDRPPHMPLTIATLAIIGTLLWCTHQLSEKLEGLSRRQDYGVQKLDSHLDDVESAMSNVEDAVGQCGQ